ncbi:MAG: hypothetical protein MUC62_09910 [Candidatus Thermoplasmatota archaeon]|jgi:hypothetical protein|nr:hypothetical protein [Candidatus Thermoplasmatota archaeon]
MTKVRLTGKLPFSEIARGSKPEHLFLPRPSRIRSDLEEMDLRSMEDEDRELEWEAVWYGNDLCRRVLKRSNKHLEYHNQIGKIYRKFEHITVSDPSAKVDLAFLIRENSAIIERWDRIVRSISMQMAK